MSRSVYVDTSADQLHSATPSLPCRSPVQPYQDANSAMPPHAIDSSSHAAPLMSLHERDLKALTSLFAQTGIEAIEEDIKDNLLWRCPEPCWEDDPFDFLREFLC